MDAPGRRITICVLAGILTAGANADGWPSRASAPAASPLPATSGNPVAPPAAASLSQAAWGGWVVLGLAALVAGLTVWTRWSRPGHSQSGRHVPPPMIRVLARQSLGANCGLLLVEADGRRLLLSQSRTGVTCLDAWSPADTPAPADLDSTQLLDTIEPGSGLNVRQRPAQARSIAKSDTAAGCADRDAAQASEAGLSVGSGHVGRLRRHQRRTRGGVA